jgi:hypothetical protein
MEERAVLGDCFADDYQGNCGWSEYQGGDQ